MRAKAALWVRVIGVVTSPFAAEQETGKKPAALTTEDSEIPVEQLELILKALTEDELLVEALGWQGLFAGQGSGNRQGGDRRSGAEMADRVL